MPGKPETLANRFCAALYEDTDGRPMQWRPISTIATRAPIREDDDLLRGSSRRYLQGRVLPSTGQIRPVFHIGES